MPARREAIRFRGQPIGGLPADQVRQARHRPGARGAAAFPVAVGRGEPADRRPAWPQGRWSLEAVYELFPVLGERRKQPSTSLSGGQQQMCAIGRALMANPDFILFDEISLGLAPVIIKDIYAALPDIVAGGDWRHHRRAGHHPGAGGRRPGRCLQEGRVSLRGPAGRLDRAAISAAYFGT